MRLKALPVGRLSENAYIYYDENTLEGVVIDPGDEGDEILGEIKALGLIIRAVLLTHGHFDHIGAVNDIKDELNIPVYAHREEEKVLNDPLVGSKKGGKSISADEYFDDGDMFKFSGCALRVIHTPGHTCGSCCYYDEAGGVLFSGDTLFLRSIGRYDLGTGDYYEICDSITGKLFTLPDETVVYPGHDRKTSIGYEKENNPFLGERTDAGQP